MQNAGFSRLIAVVICCGLFYVGHSLNRGANVSLFQDRVLAGGTSVSPSGPASLQIFTADESGTHLFVWHVIGTGTPKFAGEAKADGTFVAGPRVLGLKPPPGGAPVSPSPRRQFKGGTEPGGAGNPR
jgi:hypothetical protein